MKRVLVTRPRRQAQAFAAGLRQAGFEPVSFPVVEIAPLDDTRALDRAVRRLAGYDWLAFTSVNGVEAVWKRMEQLRVPGVPGNVRVAAIGPKTAEALRRHGVVPDFVPAEYVAEAILPGLGELRGRRVLLLRAEIARKALAEAIVKAGGAADEIAVYRTLPAQGDPAGLIALQEGVDVVTLTSPSIVQNFVHSLRRAGLDPLRLPGDPLIACIGPVTARAAEVEGFSKIMVAGEYTTDGLIRALLSTVHG